MQTIYYTNAKFETDDAVAAILLEYAERLASDGSCAIVRIPTVSQGLPTSSRLLIGSGLPVAVQSVPDADDLEGYEPAIDPFEVRRAVHEIGEQMHRLDRVVVAYPFTPGSAIDEAWNLDVDEDFTHDEPASSAPRPPEHAAVSTAASTGSAASAGAGIGADNVTSIGAHTVGAFDEVGDRERSPADRTVEGWSDAGL